LKFNRSLTYGQAPRRPPTVRECARNVPGTEGSVTGDEQAHSALSGDATALTAFEPRPKPILHCSMKLSVVHRGASRGPTERGRDCASAIPLDCRRALS
jgi:hypothetical protein